MKASLILSVYKNVTNLEAIVHSLERQTEQDFELIISEDGEDVAMKEWIDGYTFPWPMQHLTQPDEGWRKNRMLNRSIIASRATWLIFVDGDCVLHPRFVEMHLKLSGKGRVLAGKRVKLNPTLSAKLLAGQKPCWLRYLLFPNGCKLVEEAFFSPFLHLFRKRVKHLTGSNMSMCKDDILAINGFDENYVLPAIGEDYDIEWRLPANGCQIISVRNLAVQYHLYHPENWIDDSVNMQYFEQVYKQNLIICKNGINKDK